MVPQEVTQKNTHSLSPACSSLQETAQVSIMFANLPLAKTNLQWSTGSLYSNIYNPFLFIYHMVEEKKFVKYLEVSLWDPMRSFKPPWHIHLTECSKHLYREHNNAHELPFFPKQSENYFGTNWSPLIQIKLVKCVTLSSDTMSYQSQPVSSADLYIIKVFQL